jgi:predicted Zn-dependent peptidase
MVKVKTLSNGIRLVMEKMPHVRSVALGVWVDTGSVRESQKESGASHMIEHMVFKGTERRSSQQIAVEMDAVGGNLNAFTSKECTCYYAKVLDEHLPIACDILSDLVLHATFDPKELKKEKGVVLEEILMTQDSPEDLVAEICNMLFFEGDPLAPPILGTEETVSAFTQKKLLAYRDKHYTPGNLVIACAGSFDEDALTSMCMEKFQLEGSGGPSSQLKEAYPGGRRVKAINKDIEQVHICLTLPGFARDSQGQYPLAVLSNIVGGSMSSRLFQSIREKRGLAYSVYSYPMSYTTTGSFSFYAGTGEKQAGEVTKRMLDEIAKIRRKGVTEEELIRCREQLKGSYLMGMETSSAHMNAIGKELLLQKREYREEETLSRIECVTMDDILRILPVCLDPDHLCAAFVGRHVEDAGELTDALNAY